MPIRIPLSEMSMKSSIAINQVQGVYIQIKLMTTYSMHFHGRRLKLDVLTLPLCLSVTAHRDSIARERIKKQTNGMI